MSVALVAGASRGLGLLVSAELMRRGLTVHGCARSAEELDAAAELLARKVNGGVFRGSVCDVRDGDAVQQWVDAARADGDVSTAVHVAGVIHVGAVESMTRGHFAEAIDTMLWGPINLVLATLPGMRDAGYGRIGIVTSVGGSVGVPHLVPYSAAKFGATGFAQALHAELSGTGVTVTNVSPGLMRTGGHWRARFTGDAPKDYAWFGPGASVPLITVGAERAAARVVSGVLAGKPMVELTPLAIVGSRLHGLAPATMTRLLGLVGRLLPGGRARDVQSTDAPSVEGRQVRTSVDSAAVSALTKPGDDAARRNNEA